MRCGSGRTTRRGRAFTLIELVIVVVIIGVVAAIAVPRFGQAAANSQSAAVLATTRQFQTALDHYFEEHRQRSVLVNPDGTRTSDPERLLARLLQTTGEDGSLGGPLGPYLRTVPINPLNRLSTIRIGGAAGGSETHGWRYTASSNVVSPDDGRGFNIWKRAASTTAGLGGADQADAADAGNPFSQFSEPAKGEIDLFKP